MLFLNAVEKLEAQIKHTGFQHSYKMLLHRKFPVAISQMEIFGILCAIITHHKTSLACSTKCLPSNTHIAGLFL